MPDAVLSVVGQLLAVSWVKLLHLFKSICFAIWPKKPSPPYSQAETSVLEVASIKK